MRPMAALPTMSKDGQDEYDSYFGFASYIEDYLDCGNSSANYEDNFLPSAVRRCSTPVPDLAHSPDTIASDNSEHKPGPYTARPLSSFQDHLTSVDTSDIRFLDLSLIDGAAQTVWLTGRLPEWLQQLTNLEVLRAPSIGLIVVDSWLSKLRKLRAVILDGNGITTWPQHLLQLPQLEALSLEGNPCLEQLMRKSPTFRAAYFAGCPLRYPTARGLPKQVLGPEWPPLVERGTDISEGLYCGGIYTLLSPGNQPDPELLTPLGPSVLQIRRDAQRADPTNVPIADSSSGKLAVSTSPLAQSAVAPFKTKTTLFIALLNDIAILTGEAEHPDELLDSSMACEIAPIVILSDDELTRKVENFVLHESTYRGQLGEVLRLFFVPNVKKSYARKLETIFAGFPELYNLHSRVVQPVLADLLLHVRSGQTDLDVFAKKFVKLLDTGKFDNYRNYGARYISSIWALWDYTSAQLGEEEQRFDQWLTRQSQNPGHSTKHAYEYLLLPFTRLVEYQKFFGLLLHRFPEFAQVEAKFRDARSQTSEAIFLARRAMRTGRLGTHYSVRPHEFFHEYMWDALFVITSRTYLEAPNYEYETADVLYERNGRPVVKSVVHEVFSSNVRRLRLIGARGSLQIWDDCVRLQAGSVSPEDVQIESVDSESIRLHFLSVDEVCIGRIASFSSIAALSSANTRENFLRSWGRLKSGIPETDAY